MMKSSSLTTAAKRFATSSLIVSLSCSVISNLASGDEGSSSSTGSPKIELKTPERSQPAGSSISVSASSSSSAVVGGSSGGQANRLNQQTQSSVKLQSSGGQPTSSSSPSTGSNRSGNLSSGFASASAGSSASASGGASGNGTGGGQVFGNSTASGSIQMGSAPSGSTPSTGSVARSSANGGDAVSRSTIKDGDKEITVVSAVTPRQEIIIRQSSEDGIELQLKPRSRSSKTEDEAAANKKTKTFKAASIEEFKSKHAKLYPLIEKYLLSEPTDSSAVAATGNEAKSMAVDQINELIKQNAGNALIQDALRQSLEAVQSAQ